jgi:inosine-uridine nucleoside N-ribohydrolase
MGGLWVDTDLALGAARGDVDDGLALAAVVRAAPERLLGVSAVTGNTDGATAHDCIGRLLEALGSACPRSGETDAPAALVALPAGTSVLAIGPPTNLIAAARLDAGFPARVGVRVVGGVHRRWRHPLLPLFDLNLRGAAGRRFRELGFRERRMFPLDVVRRLRIDADDLDRLAGTGPAGEYLARHSRRWLARAPLRYLRRSFPAWDLVAALDAVDRLPGATATSAGVVTGFEVETARRRFFALLGSG